ncbi:MAG: NAD(P)/FAD-dependent oxidoreductase [Proteobacteria bacterium]|nr:NAD(P)/FAD-dependent oxidoreductase [Pseudomonadota bacterium]MBI3496598.1 NAD(P)/FAD-dependent oxidoreductase [Pseudomonadota bacterium]
MTQRALRRDFDVAVIGGGVVGCALFRAFGLAGAATVLIERGPDILSGASKANSAILHTGFDAPEGSLELACMRRGYAEYLRVHERLNLPLLKTGALVVAWSEAELERLAKIRDKAAANGIADTSLIGAGELRALEPGLAEGALGAVVVPGESVIDPWSAPLAYVSQGLAHGGWVRRGIAVTAGVREERGWRLETTGGPITARVVVNAAGLHGDLVEAIARPSPFVIRPRKGQFLVYDKPASRLINRIILPVPTERTKGIVLVRTAYGNLLVGPTAEDQGSRDDAGVDQARLGELMELGQRRLPGLARIPVTTAFAGLRPATQFADYQIEALPDRAWITVAGIRSTGLTGSLGIAQHVLGLYERQLGGKVSHSQPIWTPVPNLAEERPRPWQSKECGEIVCHCELVTRSEIEAAFAGPLPARDWGGLKRRTRAMLGRCQGFYCSARVAELADPHLAKPLARVLP